MVLLKVKGRAVDRSSKGTLSKRGQIQRQGWWKRLGTRERQVTRKRLEMKGEGKRGRDMMGISERRHSLSFCICKNFILGAWNIKMNPLCFKTRSHIQFQGWIKAGSDGSAFFVFCISAYNGYICAYNAHRVLYMHRYWNLWFSHIQITFEDSDCVIFARS